MIGLIVVGLAVELRAVLITTEKTTDRRRRLPTKIKTTETPFPDSLLAALLGLEVARLGPERMKAITSDPVEAAALTTAVTQVAAARNAAWRHVAPTTPEALSVSCPTPD